MRTHTFEQLSEAINDAFGRWDLAHLHEFTLADGAAIGLPDPELDDDRTVVDARRTNLGRLRLGEQFAYVFDFGDHWDHLCTVGPEHADPIECYGIVPPRPAAIFGWGELPDQYGRRWRDDDGEKRPRPTRSAPTARRFFRSGVVATPERPDPVNPLFALLRGG